MEKRRVRLEINGVVCGLITAESDEYMKSLSDEVGDIMRAIMDASPFVTREAAALTAALSFCDDAQKNGRKAAALQARVDELEVQAESPALPAEAVEQLKGLEEKAKSLEDENAALRESAKALEEVAALRERVKELEAQLEEQRNAAPPAPVVQEEKPVLSYKKRKNPLRYEEEFQQEGFVNFFEKKS